MKDIDELARYKYSGHSVLIGKMKKEWQDTESVLKMFGEQSGSARRAYRTYVEKGIEEGKRYDLTGGGLLRSAGGWEGVKALRENKVYQRNDERILGDGDFVGRVLASAEEEMERRYALKARGMDLDKIADRISKELNIKKEDIYAKGRYRRIVEARSLLCYWAVRELGISMSALARKLGISVTSVSVSVSRGRMIAKEKRLDLIE